MGSEDTRFTEEDLRYLSDTEADLLDRAIGYLKTAREVFWMGDDRRTIMPFSEALKAEHKYETRPYYPPEITDLMHAFLTARERNPHRGENRADTECRFPTFCTPTDVVEYMTFAFVRDRVCTGAFARGIENGKYLGMLLHFADCIAVWRYGEGEKRGAQH